jgi:two-component system, cell cycle sensor histidine kinase and response regulator CckA
MANQKAFETANSSENSRKKRHQSPTWLISAIWILLAAASLGWQLHELNMHVEDLARLEARSSYNKDVVYRRWASKQGGVYVPVTPHTPPNPYLDVPDRDVTTTSGKKLTLVNPAYMTRQVHEMDQGEYGARGHITSLKPIRPGNAADPWESAGLRAFEKGSAEVSSIEIAEGRSIMRLMRPMIVEPGCLKCHQKQGYREGDIRGGLSVSIPMEPYKKSAAKAAVPIVTVHLALAGLGLMGIWVGDYKLRRHLLHRTRAEQSLREMVAEQQKTSMALKAGEERFRTMTDYTSDWESWTGTDKRFVYVTQSCRRISGYAAEEFMMDPGLYQRIIHPEDRHLFSCHLEAVHRDPAPSELDFRIVTRDGEIKWISHVCQEVVGEDGKTRGRRTSDRDITERKCTETALKESEMRYRALFGQSSDHVLVLKMGPDGVPQITDANDAALRAHGFTREEMIGQPITIIDPMVTKDISNDRNRSLEEKGEVIFEVRHVSKTGEPLDVEVRARIVKIEGSEFILSVERDITERKQAELALRHSHDLMKYIIAHARSAIAVHDRDLKYVYVSERYLNDYNIKEKEVIGKHHYEIFPDLPQKWRDVHQKALKGEMSSAEEDSYQRANGNVEWTRWECRPWFESDGSIGGFIIYTEVITDRIKTQEQIRKLSRAVEQSPVSVVITDPTGAIEYANPRFTQLTGYAMEEVRGRNLCDFKDSSAAGSGHPELWSQITRDHHWTGEFQSRTKDGRTYWEFSTISPILDSQGRITHYLEIKEDVTERKMMEMRLLQAQRLESVGQLAGGIAHDFNNILAAMMMRLGLLQESQDLDDPTRQAVNDLMADAERASNMTQQLLVFSRRMVLKPEKLDLNDIVGNLFKMLGRVIGEQISLQFECQPDLPPIEADRGMIEQVIMNLSLNARDAMPKGGILTIGLKSVRACDAKAPQDIEPQKQYICLSVSDTGCGMDGSTIQRIFEPFFTTKDVGKGTGLGLATVHGIVGQHNGWIEVNSAIGKGSIFRVLLPSSRPERAKPAEPGKRKLPRGSEVILLVEDEPSVRDATARIFRYLGYRVLEAAHAGEAIEIWKAQASQIDLIFSDMVMPEEMTGLELIENLRGTKPGVKAILASGYSNEELSEEDLRKKAILRIQKPYRMDLIAQTIRQCLDNPGSN